MFSVCSRWFAVLSLLLAAPSPALAKKPIVAVFDIQTKQVRIKRATLRNLSDYLATKLAATGAYRVIPRSQLKKKLVAQKKKSYKLCYAQSCQIEIGKELSAGKSLSTKLMKVGRKCMFTATLYDLRSATTEKAATVPCKCSEDEFVTCIDRVVRKISGFQRGGFMAGGSGLSGKPSSTGGMSSFGSGGHSPGKKKRVRGSLDKEVIRRVIRKHTNEVRYCYQKALSKNPDLTGRVVVQFTINKDGQVVLSVVEKSTLGHAPTERCIAKAARGWRFPKPTGGGIVIVSYPFVLRSTDPTPKSAKPKRGSLKTSLTRSQIQTVMKWLARPLQRQCFDKYKQPGLYSVQMVIQGDGTVSQAVPKGRLAGTPTAACVAHIARTARFPRFGGKQLVITYPFVFR